MNDFEEKEYLPDISNNLMNYYRVYDGYMNNFGIVLKFPAQCKINFEKYVQLSKFINYSAIPSFAFKDADNKSKTILYQEPGNIKNLKSVLASQKENFEFCYETISEAVVILILTHESDKSNKQDLFSFKDKISSISAKIVVDLFQGIAQSKESLAIKEFTKIFRDNVETVSNMPHGLLHGKPELANFFEHDSRVYVTNFNNAFYGPAIWDVVVLLSDVSDSVDCELETVILRDYYDHLVALEDIKVSLEEFYMSFKMLQVYYRLFRFVDDDNVDRSYESHSRDSIIASLRQLHKTTSRYSEFNKFWNNICDILKIDLYC